MPDDPNSEVLTNPQHEKFAQLVAGGMDAKDAYRKVYKKTTADSAEASSSRLLGIVRPRLKWIQEQSRTSTTMDMQERREFMARVVRTKLHELDFDKDGDLVQEIVRTEGTERKAGIEKFKLPGKRECIMDDAKLAGELIDKQEIKITATVTAADVLAAQRRMPELQGLS